MGTPIPSSSTLVITRRCRSFHPTSRPKGIMAQSLSQTRFPSKPIGVHKRTLSTERLRRQGQSPQSSTPVPHLHMSHQRDRSARCHVTGRITPQSLLCFSSPRRRPSQDHPLECRWEGCTYAGHFARQSTLLRHIRLMHLSPRQYLCPVSAKCKPFNRKDNLVSHIRSVHHVHHCSKGSRSPVDSVYSPNFV